MRIGSEYFVTPTDDSGDANSHSLKTLDDGESFAIPPGQFAYVITRETVKIPKGVLAFISIRTTVKWKGLINVSGFHVDPGYQGRLTFSVYNAGPASIHLRSGDAVFLIWFADLDAETDYAKTAKDLVPPENSRIDTAALAPISGELHSLNGLATRLKNTENSLVARIAALERANGLIKVAAGALLAICMTIGGKMLLDVIRPDSKTPAATVGAAPPSSDARPSAAPAAAPAIQPALPHRTGAKSPAQ
jgi:dCTP deaminase